MLSSFMPAVLSTHYRNYSFLIPLFAIALCYQIGYFMVTLQVQAHISEIPAPRFSADNGEVAVAGKAAAKAGLSSGDQVLNIDGRPLRGQVDLPLALLGRHPQQEISLTFIPRSQHSSRVIRIPIEPRGEKAAIRDWANWVHTAPESELVTLRGMHSQLLLPVGSKDKLLGILSLGPKLSEEPYSASDVQLLRSVASHAGLAQRDLLNREIEIAREVQERLFPQRLPPIAGIDFCGTCRPALGVGGDYYDFLQLPNGDLGIAIGDVSGKGIAAALLMASLQASLCGQVLLGYANLSRLMSNVNQLIYDTTPNNREERLIPAAAAHSSHSAAEPHPVAHGRSRPLRLRCPQHDDMTLIVVKLAAAS